MSYKIIIPTCNRYMKFVQANIFSLNFYWPEHPEIIIIGYEPPKFKLPEKTSFQCIGNNDSINNWSNDIKKFIIEK